MATDFDTRQAIYRIEITFSLVTKAQSIDTDIGTNVILVISKKYTKYFPACSMDTKFQY